MLTPDRWDAWLDPARTDVDGLRELLAPPPAGLMRAYPSPRPSATSATTGRSC